jgi:hypothetical protein
MKLSKQELIDLIKQEAMAIKSTMLKESAVESTKNVFNVDMNANDGLGHSDKALVYKDKSKKTEKSGENNPATKMNQKANDLGSDEKAAAAVKVNASGKKGGSDHLAGKANASFESKDGIQSTKASAPFDDRASDSHEIEMNTEDKVVDEKAKTYVSAGSEKSGHSHTAGQAKAEVHERMPEKDAEEPTERIAKGIEIDGSNIALKESYTKKELKSLVLTEAKKAVDSYKKRAELLREFNEICSELEKDGYDLEEMLEEGWLKNIAVKLGLKDSDEKVTERKDAIDKTMIEVSEYSKNKNIPFKIYYDKDEVNQEDFAKKAQDNGYTGKVVYGVENDKEGNKFIKVNYTPGVYGASRLSSAGSSQGLGV